MWTALWFALSLLSFIGLLWCFLGSPRSLLGWLLFGLAPVAFGCSWMLLSWSLMDPELFPFVIEHLFALGSGGQHTKG
jgi:hypothetical protein